MSNKLNDTLQDIANALKYKLNTSETIAPINFISKLSEIQVEHGGYLDPTPIIEGTVKLVSNSASFIRAYAFYDCDKLTGVNFPNCSSINSGVFANCSALKAVQFDNCQTIGYNAFANCQGLNIISFPKCETIESRAFHQCSNLESVYFNACKLISAYAFQSCSKLISLSFPECETISENAFAYCSALSQVFFPKCITINTSAFWTDSNISKIDLPLAQYIGNGAFSKCTKLTNISLPECITLSDSVFGSCASLSGIVYLPKVTSLYGGAFIGTKITSVNLPECTGIAIPYSYIYVSGSKTYQMYRGSFSCNFPASTITNIYAPKCSYIGNSAFAYCSKILPDSLIIDYDNVTTIGASAFISCTQFESLSFPKLAYIGERAFLGCSNLKTLTTGDITDIGSFAFMDCSTLQNLTIPTTASLSNGAFYNCSSLSQFNAKNSLYQNYWPSSVFYNCCALRSITFLGSSISYQGVGMFYGCNNLESIRILRASNFSVQIASSATATFVNTPILDSSYLGYFGSIYVPAAYYDKCILAWSALSSRITSITTDTDNLVILPQEFLNSTISVIPADKLSAEIVCASAFKDCLNLTAAALPNCIAVESQAFEGCTALTTINLPAASIETIGRSAFAGCTALTDVSLPLFSGYIEEDCFKACTNLSTINLPMVRGLQGFKFCSTLINVSAPNCAWLSPSAFDGCILLSSISLPNCSTILEYAFRSCPLTDINLPNCKLISSHAFDGCLLSYLDMSTMFPLVNKLGKEYCFANCINLQTANLANVNYIGSSAFMNCCNLSNISISEDLDYIDINAFSGCSALPSAVFNNCNCINIGGYYYLDSLIDKSISTCIIPSQVKYLNNTAFSNCTKLERIITAVDLPYIILSNNYCAQNYALKELYILNDAHIKNYAFYRCTNLSAVYLLGSSVITFDNRPYIPGNSYSTNMNCFSSTPMWSTSGSLFVRASLVSAYQDYLSTHFNNRNNYNIKASIIGLTDEEIDTLLENLNLNN